jgi:hypothetical protein
VRKASARARPRHAGAGPSTPPALVPLLAMRPTPPQAQLASPLVEPAAGKGRPRRRDRLKLAIRPLDNGEMEPQRAHHRLGIALQQALKNAVNPCSAS